MKAWFLLGAELRSTLIIKSASLGSQAFGIDMSEPEATNNNNLDYDWIKPWELLRSGEVDRGLQLMREAFAKNPVPSSTVTLGVGLLWAGMYEVALAHFKSAARSKRTPTEDMFAFAGTAEWHLGNEQNAVDLWREGMKAPYAPGGVCIRTPMLLLMSAILRPGSFSREEAESVLHRATEQITFKWMAALGQFLLRRVDEKGLRPLWVGQAQTQIPRILPGRKWLTEFYSSVLRIKQHKLDLDTFRYQMRRMVYEPTPEWSDTAVFIELLSNPEYFIARSESEKVR